MRRITHIRAASASVLALIIASTAILGDPGTVKAVDFGGTKLLSLAGRVVAPLAPLLDALAGPQAISYGNDDRLTVLLLGTDTRTGGIGRTDTIMIMSLKGGQISAASIPRDTTRIPNYLTSSPSDLFKGRINTIARQIGLSNFTIVIETLLNIEIDYYALVSFGGFDALVNVVDPISVNISQRIKDTRYWDDSTSRGIYFPAASNYPLYANADSVGCNGKWKKYKVPPSWTWCHRALVYVRSRKGGSDFQRAARQQNFVGAAIRTVTSGDLDALVNAANIQASVGTLMTDIPFNSSALSLYSAVSNASLAHQVVFSPKKYAKHIPGTTAYALNLVTVRAWTDLYMR
jgi:anionic cell wall polymer biosynthesis LytR-Cps2A-Psr (LCP) family protein